MESATPLRLNLNKIHSINGYLNLTEIYIQNSIIHTTEI